MRLPVIDFGSPSSSPPWAGPVARSALATAVVAGAFCATVLVMMVGTFVRERGDHPLSDVKIPELKTQLVKRPGDGGLKQQIRDADTVLRQRFFVRRGFMARGGWLLLGGSIILVAGLKVAAVLSAQAPAPSGEAVADAWRGAATVRRGVAAAGLAVAGLLLALVLMQRPQIPQVAVAPAEPGVTPALHPRPDRPVAATTYPSDEELAANWPGFRGALGLGVAGGPQPPTEWDVATGKNILWKAEVPLPGHNTPIVWGNRVFLSGATADEQAVFCYDADSGKLEWRQTVVSGGAGKPEVMEDTGYAAPTMATDGRHAFALFATGDLVAFDFAGKQVWNQFQGTPDSQYGFASSLRLWRGRVIVQFDQGRTDDQAHSALLAFDAATGKELWKTVRPVRNSWSSPVVMETKGGPQVVTAGDPWVIAYDPEKGTELWRAKGLHGDVAPSPAYAGGQVFVCQEGGDLVAIRADGKGDVTETHVAWKVPDRMPDINSPLAAEQFVLLVQNDGAMACYAPTDGKMLWEHELETECDRASPVMVGKYVYQLANDGTMHVFEPLPKYKSVGTGTVGEEVDAGPAFAGGRIYIRGKTALYCVGVRN